MKPFLALCKVEMISLLSAMNLLSGKKKKPFAAPLAALIGIGIMAYIGTVYALPMAQVMLPLLLGDLYWAQMVLIAFILCLCFTFVAGSGMLFGGKDMDFLFSLPLPSHTILLCKMIALYAENLLFSCGMLIPAGVIYVIHSYFSVNFVVSLIVLCLTLPLLATIFSGILGFVVSFLSSLTPYKNLFSIILGAGGMALMFWAIFTMQTSLSNETQLLAMRQTLWNVVPMLEWICLSLAGIQSMGILWFALVCVGSLIGFLAVFSPSYHSIVLRLANRTYNRNFKMKAQNAASISMALFKKEAGRFFSTPIYLMNCGTGVIMMVLAGGYLLVQPDTVLQIAQLLNISPAQEAMLLASVGGFCCWIAPPSVVSISLEGKYLWLLQSAPVSAHRILMIKTLFSFVVFLPGVLALLLAGQIALQFPLLVFVGCLVLSLIALWFGSILGTVINMHMPRLDAPNDAVVIKQSGSAMVQCFVGMGLITVLVGGWFMLPVSDTVYFILCIVLLAIVSLGLHIHLAKNSEKLFTNLS